MDKEIDMYLSETDKQKLEALLSEAKRMYSPSALERIEEAFAIAIGAKQPITPQDPAQAGIAFFFPGLAAKPWHDPKDFPICAKLEESWETIREELEYALDKRRGFQMFKRRAIDQQNNMNSEESIERKAFYLKEHGAEFPENRAMCPETVRIIEGEPKVANYAYFGSLDPEGYIAPHRAQYNWVFTVHLGLIVPSDSAMRVGAGEARSWEEGKCMVFDASFEHEAWNRGDFTRFIFLVTTWHPDLTDIEISLLKRVNLDLANEDDFAHELALKQGRKELEGQKWWT